MLFYWRYLVRWDVSLSLSLSLPHVLINVKVRLTSKTMWNVWTCIMTDMSGSGVFIISRAFLLLLSAAAAAFRAGIDKSKKYRWRWSVREKVEYLKNNSINHTPWIDAVSNLHIQVSYRVEISVPPHWLCCLRKFGCPNILSSRSSVFICCKRLANVCCHSYSIQLNALYFQSNCLAVFEEGWRGLRSCFIAGIDWTIKFTRMQVFCDEFALAFHIRVLFLINMKMAAHNWQVDALNILTRGLKFVVRVPFIGLNILVCANRIDWISTNTCFCEWIRKSTNQI